MTEIRTSVVIPTFRRLDSLTRAIDSVMAQENVCAQETELLVVDNDAERSARAVVERYGNAPIQVRYASEPEPGVANVRNKAISEVRGRLIAFLDDDQSAPSNWLAEMLSVYDEHKSAITFGPVETALPHENQLHERYFKKFFSRIGPEDTGVFDEFYGCGNSLFDLDQLPSDGPLFDSRSNETGGEDDILFSKLDQAGHKFGWASKAPVFEHVPESRLRLRYTLRRAFAYGQAPTTICARKTPRDIPGMVFWTLVGVGQAGLFGLMSAGMYVIRHPDRAFWFDRTAQGLGKIFWFGPFEQRFYGAHAR